MSHQSGSSSLHLDLPDCSSVPSYHFFETLMKETMLRSLINQQSQTVHKQDSDSYFQPPDLDRENGVSSKHSFEADEMNQNSQHVLSWIEKLHVDTHATMDSRMDSPVLDAVCPSIIVGPSGNDHFTLTPPSTPKTYTVEPFSPSCRPVDRIHRRRSSSDFCFDIKNIELDITHAELLGSGLWSKVYKLNPSLPSLAHIMPYSASPPTDAPIYSALLTPPTTPQKAHVPFTLPRAFAIKVATRPDALPVFESEARILEHLQTDSVSENHIVPFYGLSTRSKALIFQCANHGTLEDLITTSSSRTPAETLALFTAIAPQLIAGLHFMHSKGVVHADIKPANILLDTDPAMPGPSGMRARFADFSASFLCADFGSLVLPQQAGAFGGTWTFMAPEQLSRDPASSTPTFASDVYSLGVTLMALLVGGNPFEAVSSNLFMLREAVKVGDVFGFALREWESEKRIAALEKEWRVVGRDGDLVAWVKPALKKKREERCSAAEWMALVR